MKQLFVFFFFLLSISVMSQNAVVLHNNTDIVLKSNKLTKTNSVSILINNKNAEHFCDIKIYSSQLIKTSNIKANITDINGKEIKKLRNSEILKHDATNDQVFYNDLKVQEFSLRHNIFPYILNYSYDESEEQFLYIDYWTPVSEANVSTLSGKLNLSIPADYEINYRTSANETIKPDTIGNQLIYKWNCSYSGLPVSEKYSPEQRSLYPYVKIVPVKFQFEESGSLKSWKTYGNWEYDIISKRQDLPQTETLTINGLVENTKDTVEIIKILYHYLQDQTRYINISENTGGMVPHPASYVCKNKYGDCKALSNYFISLLKQVGIRGVYTSVYAGEQITKTDKSFPSQQFNHVIVCVPLKKDTIWLDCTSKLPFNYLGSFTQGRCVLLTEKDNSHYTYTPALTTNMVKVQREITVSSNEDLMANVEFHNTYRGTQFEALSYLINDNKSDKDMYMRNNVMPNEFELAKYDIEPHNRDSTFININLTATSASIFTRYGNDVILKTVSLQIPNMEQPSLRKYDVQIDYPVVQSDRQTYILGNQFRVDNLPVAQSIKSEFGEYSCKYRTLNNLLIVEKAFSLRPNYISKKDYAKFFQFITSVYETERANNIAVSKK